MNGESKESGSRGRSWVTIGGGLVVGLAAGIVSIVRLLVTDSTVLTNALWAEDGLFPLCVVKESTWTCLADPFAGYLLFVPRLLAGLVAMTPIASWPLVTNLVAATLAGLAAFAVFVLLRASGRSWPVSAMVAGLPVLAPIVGLEAINVYASVYMLLLYVMAIALAFPQRSRWWLGLSIVGMVVTALTIPSAVVLLVPLAVSAARRRIPLTWAGALAGGLLVGLVGQFAVAFSAENRRNLAPSWQAFVDWLDAVPDAILTTWPGMAFGPETIFGQFELKPFGPTGAVIVLAIALAGGWAIIRGSSTWPGVGALLWVGIVVGAIPAVTGYAGNRYYVVPVLLWLAAGLIAVDLRWGARRWLVGALIVALLVLWIPAYATGTWRAKGTPAWPDELARIAATCSQDPAAFVDVKLSPEFWPPDYVTLTEPSTARAKCVELAPLVAP